MNLFRRQNKVETELRNRIADDILSYAFSDDYYRALEWYDSPEEGLLNALFIAADIARKEEPLRLPPRKDKVEMPEWLKSVVFK